jgi:hypothetical protein
MKREGSRGDTPHNQIIRHRVGDMEVELIHQTFPGDCVLINYLNSESLINGRGKIAMQPSDLRRLVVERRQQEGEPYNDIDANNTPLSYKDTVRLFETFYGVKARQEDIVTVNGLMEMSALRSNIEHGLLEYLDTYNSGLCTTGMGYHSRTLWKLDNDAYIVIDPMDLNGFKKYSKRQVIDFLTDLCHSQEPDNNFFMFLRNKEDQNY